MNSLHAQAFTNNSMCLSKPEIMMWKREGLPSWGEQDGAVEPTLHLKIRPLNKGQLFSEF